MNKLILFFIIVMINSNLWSQGCPTGNLLLETQGQIDNFSTNYPDCYTTDLNLRIEELVAGNITNLDGLIQLEGIGRHLRIYANSNLTSLEGLNNIANMTQTLTIYGNQTLTDLNALSSLTSVGGELSINQNRDLASLNGLHNIVTVGRLLNIENNNSLPNLKGLDAVETLEEGLLVHQNDGLTSLEGIENLTSALELYIGYNVSLKSVEALSNLTSLGGNASSTIRIEVLSVLTSLEGLDNIDPNSFKYLKIVDSPQLSFCSVQSICDYLRLNVNPAADIQLNATDCNSKIEVEDNCAVIALPVVWSDNLHAILDNNSSLLSWSIESQYNNEKFIIQHSIDGANFLAVGEVKGDGNSAEEKEYRFQHQDPKPGANYYRVKQVDYDEKYSFSSIATVILNSDLLGFYPNPSTDYIHINAPTDQTISIYNQANILIEKINIVKGLNKIYLSSYSKGIYYLKSPITGVTKLVIM